MLQMRIDDCVVTAYTDGSNYIVPVLQNDEPIKVFSFTQKEFWIFVQCMCYVARRQKIAVSDYVRRMVA